VSPAVSARALKSIGEVLALLRADFPDVTISKIRFLESEGLIEPARAPSGYRKFSSDDVARLRYVLAAQRDHYLPLRVIKDHLDALDRGLEPPSLGVDAPRVPRAVTEANGYPSAEWFAPDRVQMRLSRAELLEAAGIDEDLLAALEEYGLVTARRGSAPFDADAVVVAKTAGVLAAFGLEPRHLRQFKGAADREVGLVEALVAPLLRQRDPQARARADEVAREVGALSVRLHAALVKAGMHQGLGR
jgi:DNA-binding transcriptional MerR regulator